VTILRQFQDELELPEAVPAPGLALDHNFAPLAQECLKIARELEAVFTSFQEMADKNRTRPTRHRVNLMLEQASDACLKQVDRIRQNVQIRLLLESLGR
jgi:hypothetical protein